jgi:hypothetical protein
VELVQDGKAKGPHPGTLPEGGTWIHMGTQLWLGILAMMAVYLPCLGLLAVKSI